MKRIICLISLLLITGCASKISLQNEYDEMNKLDSYELSLRIFGNADKDDINEAYIIDNYKNSEYKVTMKSIDYYVLNNKTYKENVIKGEKEINVLDFNNLFSNEETKTYEEVTDKLFINTNLLLEGVINSKSIKEVEKKSDDNRSYELKLTKDFTDKLLGELNHGFNYKKSSATVNIYNNNIYKVVYNIDDLTISATFTNMNKIEPFNLNI